MVRLADSKAARYDDLLLKMDEVRNMPLTITGFTEQNGAHGPYLHVAVEHEATGERATVSTGAAAVMDQLSKHFLDCSEPLEHVVFEERVSKKGSKYWLLADADEAAADAQTQVAISAAHGLVDELVDQTVAETARRTAPAAPAIDHAERTLVDHPVGQHGRAPGQSLRSAPRQAAAVR